MAVQGAPWSACQDPDVVFHEWDGERVYHAARSGDTHLITADDLLVLKALERGPVDAAELVVRTGDADNDEQAEMAVAASLDRLHRLGLARPLLP